MRDAGSVQPIGADAELAAPLPSSLAMKAPGSRGHCLAFRDRDKGAGS